MKAPFPWFGGKSRVADVVWSRFGDVRNYVEPFAGSLAVLLARPGDSQIETVNDADCYLANFWRALKLDPHAVAAAADWPVNEADLHARHNWLVDQAGFRERMKTDPEFFDARIAGWWVWGICQWIGSGWCSRPEWMGRSNAGRRSRGILTEAYRQKPELSSGGRGVHAKRPHLMTAGEGVHSIANQPPPPDKAETYSQSSERRPSRKLPSIGGGARGIHSDGFKPDNGGRLGVLYEYFEDLASRLRNVRVCCGDWARVLTPSVTEANGLTGILLDPPYSADRDEVYSHDSMDVAHAVREWALANGDNPMLRIALCGYEGEHEMPESWSVVAWKAVGGYGNQGNSDSLGKKNAKLERIWFSPHCLKPEEGQISLFQEAA
ncbi:D12 class N6 adenine-specific DNA methyltransferase [uncultured Caudovirales phage]|uniref:D12 class N6 adenine-specific DNA methyltransferase n=1 Tax=uncultured Caudovirales phage TaxID=2100421 RepID=A0A6J5LBQ3_9CAUD|nr:D12 class N6 adenine-specific DNA methyltransferase [uncultured Caudovirales phage]